MFVTQLNSIEYMRLSTVVILLLVLINSQSCIAVFLVFKLHGSL